MNQKQPAHTDNPPNTRLGRFFYATEVPYGLALVRIFLPLALLGAMLPRWFHAREMYSTDGAATPLWVTYGYQEMLPEIPGAPAVALFTALIFFLFAVSIGWCTRISLVCSFVLFTYFSLIDAVSTMTKYSVVASHVLLLLSLSQCGSVWSLDSWLSGKKRKLNFWPGEPAITRTRYAVWPKRLLQLLIAIVYLGSAITKMQTPAFFSGDQLQTWMITNVNFGNSLGEQLAMHPALLVGVAYITIVWEMVFLFLIWNKTWRIWMLGIGAAFHTMTMMTLGLVIFPLVYFSIYWSFLDEEDVRGIARRLRRLKRKLGFAASRRKAAPAEAASPRRLGGLPVPSPAVWASVTALVIVVGIEAEFRMDPYGIRRPEGPYELKELDAEYVENRMLAPSPKIRPVDAISFFETGTTLVAGLLVNKRREFTQGETITVQCSLNSPHEDMWLECRLQDDEGYVIDRTGQIVSREMLRANFYYKLNEAFQPGRYQLVLTCAGTEVIRRAIVLKPQSRAPVQAGIQTAVAN